jgi:PAS domain S-box-containing protein
MESTASQRLAVTAELKTASDHELSLVAQAIEAVNRSDDLDSLCAATAKGLRALAPCSYVGVALPEHRNGAMRLRAIAGLNDHIDAITQRLGAHPCAISAPPYRAARLRIDTRPTRLRPLAGGLSAFVNGAIDESECRSIEQDLDIRHIYTAFFPLEYGAHGSFTMFARTRLHRRKALDTLCACAAAEIRRRCAEKAFTESESRYRAIFYRGVTPMLLIDPGNGAILDANRAAENFYGYAPQRLCALTLDAISECGPDEERHELLHACHQSSGSYLTRHRLSDGDVREVKIEANLIQIENDPAVFVMVHDQSGHHRARQTLEQFFSHSSVLLGITDADGAIVRINPAFASLLGASPESLRGRSMLEFIDPEDLPRTLRAVRRLGRDGSLTTVTNRIVAGEQRRTLEWTITVDEERKLYYGVARDITEHQRVEEQLHQNQKMQAIGQLAGGIAHDFNNILAGIIGYTDITVDFLEPGSRLSDNLKRVLSAAERARCLINQVLTFSRPAKQGRKPLFLKPLLNEVAGLLRASLPSSIDLVTRLGGERYPVMADPSRIQECIMNLAANAAHAMNDRGRLTIMLSQERFESPLAGKLGQSPPGEYACIAVKDSGCGMGKKLIERIFEPYFSTSEESAAGLGLPVVYGILRSHDGNIAVHSKVGKGSTFLLYIPVCKDAVRDVEADHAAPLAGGKERILFVDDEEMLTAVAEELLGGLGYEVIAYRDPVAAFRALQKDPSRFDCLITDLTMPRMNGIQLTEKALGVRPDLPVILCTGYCNQENEKRARDGGIRAFCSKPLSKLELSEVVRRSLDGKVENDAAPDKTHQ